MKPKLKSGMLIQLRNRDIYMVIRDCAVNSSGWISAGQEDLNNPINDEYDIVAVSKVLNTYNLYPVYWTRKTLKDNLLWERKEKEEKMHKIGDKKYSESTIKEALKEYVQD